MCALGCRAHADAFTSPERKTRDCAEAFERRWGCASRTDPCLAEIDRSSTGYVPPPRFWEIVEAFFAEPEASVLGWERAVDAQARIKAAGRRCANRAVGGGDVCLFSHGGVGTLLLCDLMSEPISRRRGQPLRGRGCFFAFDANQGRLLHGWTDIVP